MLTENKINEIKERTDIVEIISESVTLKKAGVNFKGLCPFHSEKTPSFTVSPAKQIFYCFGCGVGGDVFSFLEKYHGITFSQAAEELANRYGITISKKPLTKQQKIELTEQEKIFTINEKTSSLFCQNLLKNQEGQKALNYLIKRGITKETINVFKLGFALDSWDYTFKYLLKNSNDTNIILKAGLIKKSDKSNKLYDRFRNRIIFPIFDVKNKIIGFGGRVLDDSMPKYLNSPETPLYSKSHSLYGLNFAYQHIIKENKAYIVEGYFDQIALYQHNIKNVVATLGTALTSFHIRRLKVITKNIILVYDADNAGIEAAKRSVPIFIQENIEAKIVILPKGEDPDSYIFKLGEDNFRDFAKKQAINLFEFLVQHATDKYSLSINGKLAIIEELLPIIVSIKEEIKKSLYIKYLSEVLNIKESALREKIGKNSKTNKSVKQKKIISDWDKVEEKIVVMMLNFQEILDEIEKHDIVNMFEHPVLKDIAKKILENRGKDLIQKVDEEEKRGIINSFFLKDEKWNLLGAKKLLNQFILNFEKKRNLQLLKDIKEAQDSGDKKLLMELLAKQRDKHLNK